MPLSQASRNKLNTCDPRLVALVREVAQRMEVQVLCGHRDQAEQDKAFAAGNSKTPWPKSKHNQVPSLAVDLAPLPIDWKNIGAFLKMVSVVKQVAVELGIPIRCGADFTTLKDYPHIELIG